MIDLTVTFIYFIRRKPVGVVVAVDPLNFLYVYILKIFERVNKIVYYSLDYAYRRFDNSILNKIYHMLDLFAVKKSNLIWNACIKIKKVRRRQGAHDRKNIYLPNTPILHDVSIKNENEIDKFSLVNIFSNHKQIDFDIMFKVLSRLIEHFNGTQVINIFKETHRILKVNRLLHIQCPHFTSMIALTDFDHKKSFSVTSFGILEGNNYVFPRPLFKKELIKINILLTLPSENKYVDFDLEKTDHNIGQHPIIRKLLLSFALFFQFFIDLSPIFFERFWCYWIGGADEIIYRGRKI